MGRRGPGKEEGSAPTPKGPDVAGAADVFARVPYLPTPTQALGLGCRRQRGACIVPGGAMLR